MTRRAREQSWGRWHETPTVKVKQEIRDRRRLDPGARNHEWRRSEAREQNRKQETPSIVQQKTIIQRTKLQPNTQNTGNKPRTTSTNVVLQIISSYVHVAFQSVHENRTMMSKANSKRMSPNRPWNKIVESCEYTALCGMCLWLLWSSYMMNM